ncbi:reverse transcriptase domain-containing protein [Moraxella boevrei]|uniref:reverse transcriptase domain-containing protein n=1 Tax=Faucicola boevrei TaxID=346665 RepID=UPI003734E50C
MSNVLFSPLYHAYQKARKKKKPSYNQLAFEGRLLDNLTELSEQLASHTWQPRPYLSFVALKPKARQIHAPDFGDRVVHHWLVPQLEQIFEPKFIHDSYANRIGKGTHQAVKRLQKFVQKIYNGKTGKTNHQLADNGKGYYLQCDIANFFNSIHRPTLYELIRPHIQHLTSSVQSATYQLLFCTVQQSGVRQKATVKQLQAVPKHKKLENAKPDCGLPIGNLSSQFFANVYLNALDQFVKHTLKAQYYVRYVDDFILLSDSQSELLTWLTQIEQFLHDVLQLSLKKSPICKPILSGIDFLGFVVFPHHIQVRRRVVANLRHKLYQKQTLKPTCIEKKQGFCRYFKQPCMDYYLHDNVAGFEQLRSVYASYLGHIRHANHQLLLHKLYRDYPYLQRFHVKVKFDIASWFIHRPIWLWTALNQTDNVKISHPLYINQQEQSDDPINPNPKNMAQAIQLCFDFGD